MLSAAAGILLIPAIFLLLNNRSTYTPVIPGPVEYPNPDGLTIGSSEALLQLEEYSDFQCPSCRRFHESIFPLLLEEYIQPGLISFTYKPLPILDSSSPDRESHLAAEAALCAADQDSFWPFHDVLFANQGTPNSGQYLPKNLEVMAEGLNLDTAAFSDCLSSGTYTGEVEKQLFLGLQEGIQATPTLVLNGEILEWAAYGELQEILNKTIEEAQNL
ncbi:MAG: DsbA family protein [Anaerolineales bacterium]|nr:DsbA family protein [Anaerolineales bacterium]